MSQSDLAGQIGLFQEALDPAPAVKPKGPDISLEFLQGRFREAIRALEDAQASLVALQSIKSWNSVYCRLNTLTNELPFQIKNLERQRKLIQTMFKDRWEWM